MNICQAHWDKLKAAIDERGLQHLVARDGSMAVAQVEAQLRTGETAPTNFDPLMAAFWGIGSNGMRMIQQAGGNALYLMSDGPEDLVDPDEFPDANGRTWPKCTVCYLNLAHELTCKEPECKLPKEDGYEWVIGRAADDSLAQAKELGLVQ